MQVAVDFNEALQPTPAQTVSNYKIVSEGGISLPIQSAVYSDNGTLHRVVLTVRGRYGGRSRTSTTSPSTLPTSRRRTVTPRNQRRINSGWMSPGRTHSSRSPCSRTAASPFPGRRVPGLFAAPASDCRQFHRQRPHRLDGATGKSADGTVLLLKNNGDNTYAAPVPVSLGGAYTVAGIAYGELESRWQPRLGGRRDTELEEPITCVLLNDGHGNFSNAPETPIPMIYPPRR